MSKRKLTRGEIALTAVMGLGLTIALIGQVTLPFRAYSQGVDYDRLSSWMTLIGNSMLLGGAYGFLFRYIGSSEYRNGS